MHWLQRLIGQALLGPSFNEIVRRREAEQAQAQALSATDPEFKAALDDVLDKAGPMLKRLAKR